MHHQLTRTSRRSNERGAVAIVVALSLTALLVVVGLVVDFGLVRIDRQIDKSAADSASLAGAHGLDAGDGSPHAYMGVCTALRYLKQNSARFGTINEATGWTNGNGAATASGCSDPTLRAKQCVSTDLTTWARFTWSGSWQGTPVNVYIASGYQITGSGWSEDSLPAAASDADDLAGGCDQIAVVVSQKRKPGLGTLATSSDLATSIRSVARVVSRPGGNAPAMLLLKQTGCDVLTAGAAAGGSTIHVVGALSSNGLTQPGTIHSDSDGSGCPSNTNIFTGQAANGIVAYAAPLASSPGSADPSKPGQITAYAAALGASPTVLRDATSRVCGSTGLSPSGTCPGVDVLGRGRIYRKMVDQRYLSAVSGAVGDANTSFGAVGTYVQLSQCDPTQAQVDALNLTSASFLYINCTANNGFNNSANLTINAGTVVFAGKVNPAAALTLARANHVYIAGDTGNNAAALTLGNGATFSVHTQRSDGTSNLNGSSCSNSPTNVQDKAVMVIKAGTVTQSGGTLQLCYTTLVMMGGQSGACLPGAPSIAAPNPSTPCGAQGSGQLTQTGGDVDWTAPNRYDVMTLSDGTPDPARAPEWTDKNGPEDLAFWSESGGTGSNPKYQMTGAGGVHLVGVLVTPNAQPFNLSGQFSQTLTNAQYVASSVALSSNNTTITMTVDPNSAVTVPTLEVVGLVR